MANNSKLCVVYLSNGEKIITTNSIGQIREILEDGQVFATFRTLRGSEHSVIKNVIVGFEDNYVPDYVTAQEGQEDFDRSTDQTP